MRRLERITLLAAALIAVTLPVDAAPNPQKAAPAADKAAPATKATPAAPAEVTGFRAAQFGMSEAEVRGAIVKDFKLKDTAIEARDNPMEKTRVLTAAVANLLPDSGKAVVSYLLGFKSKKLFAVNINWSAAADAASTPDKLIATAGILAGHFEAAGYQPASIVRNLLLADGRLVVFRGADRANRTVQVTLLGEATEKDGNRVFTPGALQLSYIQDPDHPDVFKLQPGQF